MCVRWGIQLHPIFLQIMVLSKEGLFLPNYFNTYKDDLSMHLNSSGIGDYLGTAFINHLYYADDLCLINLSSSGMQQLLHICNGYAA